MEITSLYFVLLSLVSIFLFYLISHRYRTLYLAFISCCFIASYSYSLLFYLIAFSLINYCFGIWITVTRFRKTVFRAGIIINLLQLIMLKYASFAINPVFQLFHSSLNFSKLSEIIIPIGISYFTLQGIGYLINIKMTWEKPERKFLDFLLYITFYPKFLSGPVERSNHFLPQLKIIKSFDEQQVSAGLRIALFGLFKKLAIANQIAPYINSAYSNLNSNDGYSFWIFFLLQPIYLYFDFSGYTDIAIGFSKTFGIDLLPNFNRPFLAENVTTFWKRFHISLSSWFNDYVFRQTSFRLRRWGIYASVYALFITWTLFGIWHGAGWNFMVLGLLQALVITYEFFTKGIRIRLFSKVPVFVKIWFGRLLTYLFYCGALVFFFSPDINSALIYFSKLADFRGPSLSLLAPLSTTPFSVLIYIAVFLLLELIQNDFSTTFIKLESYWSGYRKQNRFFRWSVYFLIITILFVVGNKAQQFIYIYF